MRRYISLIVMVIAIVLCIGTFYIKSAASAGPEFIIKKQSGDEKEAKSVIVDGTYQKGSLVDNVSISSQGSEYQSDGSIAERIDQLLMNNPGIEQLQKNYREFMRGKNGANSFYEDRDFLLYANTVHQFSSIEGLDFEFQVSILDKQSENETSFKLQVPDSTRYSHIIVEDVQMIGSRVKVVTRNGKASHQDSDMNTEELHVYSIDLAHKKVTGEKTVLGVENQNKDVYTDFLKIEETDHTHSSKFVFFQKVTNKHVLKEDGSYSIDMTNKELFMFDLESNKGKTIVLPKGLLESVHMNLLPFYDSNMLYFPLQTKGRLEIASYDIAKEKVVNRVKLDQNNTDTVNLYMKIKDGKVYVLEKVGQDEQPASIVISNLETGKSLYKGVITIKDGGIKMNETDAFVNLSGLIAK
ncbi:hypothetical protein J7E71_19165 [Mesobacillus foraminis]|uniref:hypothetical protein n=1 Tax=Mesobacillus foraminis TaxID=279826 RepID=UPI001BEA2D4D|nr:hypothetical protein [Mesobacillus foraminis]MBT2757994.1 hypothetical protein [Mesobacillus foraminis]